MDTLRAYSIQIRGLKEGISTFNYTLGREFFTLFEGNPIEDGIFQIVLDLDKRGDLMVLDFEIKGKSKEICDRCTADIKLPVHCHYQVVVKRAEGEEDDPDLIYLEPGESILNIGNILYEYVCLSLPLIKVYDCDSEDVPPCNRDVLAYITKDTQDPAPTDERWNDLKQFNLDQ